MSPRILRAPLLAFERKVRRLRHGAGYHKILLRHLRPRGPAPLAIGVAFAGQEVEEEPAGPRDQALGAGVTEEHLHRCPAPDFAALEAEQA